MVNHIVILYSALFCSNNKTIKHKEDHSIDKLVMMILK